MESKLLTLLDFLNLDIAVSYCHKHCSMFLLCSSSHCPYCTTYSLSASVWGLSAGGIKALVSSGGWRVGMDIQDMFTAKTVSGRKFNFDNFITFWKQNFWKFLFFFCSNFPCQSRGFVNSSGTLRGWQELFRHNNSFTVRTFYSKIYCISKT